MSTKPDAKSTDIRASWRMGGITQEPVEDYLYSLLPERDGILQEMEADAAARNVPIVGPAVGRLLYQLALMIGANHIFEMGSATGYSTIWWARALGPGGKVFYTDGSQQNADRARRNLERAGVLDRVVIHVGDALELLSEQKVPLDIIFNDVDKEDYPRVLRLAAPRLRKGGLFVTDNVLWSGRVASPANADSTTRAILEFNRQLYRTPGLLTTVIPLRDGVSVSLKI
jgi:caffeoyl-CoA O-methyltransferase